MIVILFLFLGNLRTTMISLTAMPVSLLCAVFALKLFGGSFNTMTLGGMAIATLIILVVFLPLFFLSGVEGRLLQPLGISYMVSIGASLLVALTVAPALCSYLLSKSGYLAEHGDSRAMQWLLSRYRPLLEQMLKHSRRVMAGAALTFALALGLLFLAGRDLRAVYQDVRSRLDKVKPPPGYFVEYGGQFESEAGATRMIGLLSIVSISLILLILYMEFGSFRVAGLVMVNLPLAFIGGIVAVVLTDRVISVASLVGFITLFGIATSNGILLVSHYRYLMEIEGLAVREAVVKGSLERLRPVVMTALALVPFAVSAHKTGNEILSPLATVILGRLISATILNMLALPVLYLRYGAQQNWTQNLKRGVNLKAAVRIHEEHEVSRRLN